MCMGCMGNADFLLTGGILGAASLRVTARRFLSAPGRRHAHKVTDAEVEAFIGSLAPGDPAAEPGASATSDEAGPDASAPLATFCATADGGVVDHRAVADPADDHDRALSASRP